MTSISVKMPDMPAYSPWFWPESENFDLGKNGHQAKAHLKGSKMVQISGSEHLPVRSKKAPKNDLNFGQNAGLYVVHGFRPESENLYFGKNGYYIYQAKALLKRSRMVQISAWYSTFQ